MSDRKILVVVFLFFAPLVVAQEQSVTLPGSADFPSNLEPHPRLILTESRLKELKELYKTDETLREYVAEIIEKADQLIDAPVLKRDLVGIRLLAISRECVGRIYTLGVAWRWTGDNKYAQAAVRNLKAVCGFEDWNPQHFLDTAEMTHAVSIGYDWFYSSLNKEDRDEICDAIIQMGLEPGYNIHVGKLKTKHAWPRWNNNWNQVCNYSMIIGSLAVADTNPEYVKKILPLAVESLPLAMAHYSPDGAWPEGPNYWEYATWYTVCGLSAMDTALGMNFNLSQTPGFAETVYFPLYMSGPTDKDFNFADSRREGLNLMKSYPFAMWLGAKFGIPFAIASQHKRYTISKVESLSPMALNVVFYQPSNKLKSNEMLPLDKFFDGAVQTAVFRSSWTDPDAIYLAVKAGDNQFPHAHLDLGSFVLDAFSVRWICDLGADLYDLPGYWEMGSDGRRWDYYRLGSKSHNILTFNDMNQNVFAKARITDFNSTEDMGSAVLDLTDAYEDVASQVSRKVSLLDKRCKVLVEDVFDVKSDCIVTWGITTQTQIKILSSDVAELSMGDKKMTVELLHPSNVSFYMTPCPTLEPPQYDLERVSRLEVKMHLKPGEEKIIVLFSPVRCEK